MTAASPVLCDLCRDNLHCPTHYREPEHVEAATVASSVLSAHRIAQQWKPLVKGLTRPSRLLPESPLFLENAEQPGTYSPRLPARYLLTGAWEVVVFHALSYALLLDFKGLLRNPSVEVVTDLELIERRYDRNPEKVPFSQSAVKAGFVVLRLSFMGTKNSELSGVLWEIIRLREDKGLPIFVVCDPSRPWSKSHPAYSEDVASLLEAKFTKVTIR